MERLIVVILFGLNEILVHTLLRCTQIFKNSICENLLNLWMNPVRNGRTLLSERKAEPAGETRIAS